ncbi:hypothetical protein ACFQY4_18210 [Catellatospora bangladeshensis]|uniref:hypothetical protein n=1 Tax=Catellatospora bangladeshensis TaxID=310355 RepID=UPI003623E08D
MRLLNLGWMAQHNATVHRRRWHVWRQVVQGTRDAQPLWRFVDRHLTTPKRGYSLEQAHRDFRAQPRIAAMEIYNNSGRAVTPLPLDHLEAFQVGCEAYVELGYHTAVPGNAMVALGGQIFECRPNQPLSQLWEFMKFAAIAMRQMSPDDCMVALLEH